MVVVVPGRHEEEGIEGRADTSDDASNHRRGYYFILMNMHDAGCCVEMCARPIKCRDCVWAGHAVS